MQKRYRTVKYACYMTNVSMAAVANLSPLLFLTFREVYGISYSLLGLLVLLNFCTQLAVDLLFSFFFTPVPDPKDHSADAGDDRGGHIALCNATVCIPSCSLSLPGGGNGCFCGLRRAGGGFDQPSNCGDPFRKS